MVSKESLHGKLDQYIFCSGYTNRSLSSRVSNIKNKKKTETSVERDIRSDNALRSDIHGYSSLTFAVSRINTPWSISNIRKKTF